jgi:hypothetical protein
MEQGPEGTRVLLAWEQGNHVAGWIFPDYSDRCSSFYRSIFNDIELYTLLQHHSVCEWPYCRTTERAGICTRLVEARF